MLEKPPGVFLCRWQTGATHAARVLSNQESRWESAGPSRLLVFFLVVQGKALDVLGSSLAHRFLDEQ